MFGKVVTTKGICIVEHKGERLYLSRNQAEGFQLGQMIEFDCITHTLASSLREISGVKTLPLIVNSLPEPEANHDEIDWLLQKHGLNEKHPKDLTHLETFSIDPEGSQDLDDALSFTSDFVYVHIPYFRLSDELNSHARDRQFSIYFPDSRPYHLLPLELSINQYSLLQDCLRLTWTVKFDSQMNLINVFLAYIVNKHQLTYQEAELKPKILDKAYEIFEFRQNLAKTKLPSYDYIIGENGLSEIKRKEHLQSHSLIEFYMVKTNSAIAEYLMNKGILFPRRAHDQPKAGMFSSNNHDQPKETPDTFKELPSEIQNYLRIISSPAAYYTTSEKCHSDLNLQNYTHFTSPIRRYIDQIISRLLFGEKFNKEELDEICAQANAQERKIDAMNEEYLSRRIKEYLNDGLHARQHEGIITLVSKWGIHMMFPHLRTKAELHVSKLKAGRLTFENNRLVGTEKTFRYGDKVILEFVNDSWNLVVPEPVSESEVTIYKLDPSSS